jgi:hypothetical protein
MIAELLDRRVLGAVRFVDAVTGLEVAVPLQVTSPGVRWIWNRRGWGVIADAPGLHHHTETFPAPPAGDAIGSRRVELGIVDPSGAYLARRVTIALPRDPDPEHAAAPGSLFRPVEARMFRSPAAGVSLAWAVVRVSVSAAGTGRGLGGVLVRVLRGAAAPVVMASGMSDRRGEALVAVPGVPVTTFGSGANVLATEVSVTLQAIVDPDGREPPDPDDLETRLGAPGIRSASVEDVALASGRTVVQAIAVTL